jgi:hypothetical protein
MTANSGRRVSLMFQRRVQQFLMDRLRPGWRERAAAQASPWTFIERLVALGLCAALCYLLIARGEFFQHFRFHPEDKVLLGNPNASFPAWLFVGIFAQGFFLLCISMIIMNWLESLYAPLKRWAERGSDRFPELTIRNANRELWKAALCLGLLAVPSFIAGIALGWQHHPVISGQASSQPMAVHDRR